jgi:hypothetical protein
MMTMVQKPGRGGNYVTMFNTFDFDPCHTDVRVEIVSDSVMETWKNVQGQTEPNYQQIVGCNGMPKWALLWQLPSGPGQNIYAQAMPFQAQVTDFNADDVVFKVSSIPQAGWFYYADAFAHGWKAFVNGAAVPVQETADGFKAVAIDGQAQRIEFRFFDPLVFSLQYLLCVGALIGLGLLIFIR